MNLNIILLIINLLAAGEPIKSFELSHVTRGNQKYITITKNITILNVNGEIDTLKTSPKTWKSLTALCKNINFTNVPKIKVNNKKQRNDGAMIANFTINTKSHSYKTNSFDHDSPPVQLKSLISTMVKCNEKVVSKF